MYDCGVRGVFFVPLRVYHESECYSHPVAKLGAVLGKLLLLLRSTQCFCLSASRWVFAFRHCVAVGKQQPALGGEPLEWNFWSAVRVVCGRLEVD